LDRKLNWLVTLLTLFLCFCRVLCPGSGLGRLPFEVAKRGYGCQGNEFSFFMLLGNELHIVMYGDVDKMIDIFQDQALFSTRELRLTR
jgi:hypothetical protein